MSISTTYYMFRTTLFTFSTNALSIKIYKPFIFFSGPIQMWTIVELLLPPYICCGNCTCTHVPSTMYFIHFYDPFLVHLHTSDHISWNVFFPLSVPISITIWKLWKCLVLQLLWLLAGQMQMLYTRLKVGQTYIQDVEVWFCLTYAVYTYFGVRIQFNGSSSRCC